MPRVTRHGCSICLPHFGPPSPAPGNTASPLRRLSETHRGGGRRVRPPGVRRTRQAALDEAGSGVGGWAQVGLGSRQPSAPTLGPSGSEAVESLPRGAPRLTMAPVSARREGRGAIVLRDTFPPGLAAGSPRPGTLGTRLLRAPEGGMCPHLCVCVLLEGECVHRGARASDPIAECAHARLACWGAVSEQACGSLRLPACFLGASAAGCVSASRYVSGAVYLVCAPGSQERRPSSASVCLHPAQGDGRALAFR